MSSQSQTGQLSLGVGWRGELDMPSLAKIIAEHQKDDRESFKLVHENLTDIKDNHLTDLDKRLSRIEGELHGRQRD